MVKMKMILNMITAWVNELFRRVKSLALARRSTAVIMTAVMLLSVVSAVVIPQVNKSSAMEDGLTTGKIISFERYNPVYTSEVDLGTTVSGIGLPETLRAEMELEGEYTFSQTRPALNSEGKYDYYYYGYVICKDADKKYENGDLVIYTISYADGTRAYRVYGTMDGENEGFYACDENGNITAVVYNIPVTWNTKRYYAEKTGEYSFKAAVEGYKYSGTDPVSVITVVDRAASHLSDNADDTHDSKDKCTCSVGKNEYSSEHDNTCPFYIYPCTCSYGKEEFSDEHDVHCSWYREDCDCPEGDIGTHNSSCKYYKLYKSAEGCTCGVDSTSYPWQHDESCPCFREIEVTDCTCVGGFENHDETNTRCPLYEDSTISTQSINGGGPNDVLMDNMINNYSATSGNVDSYDEFTEGYTPGIWRDYVITMAMNSLKDWAWTKHADTNAYNGWSWSGTVADQTTGTVESNPRRIPAMVSGRVAVYSGEQLLYALRNFVGPTIHICGNLDLNGSNYAWPTVYLYDQGIRLTGNPISDPDSDTKKCSIYNLSLYGISDALQQRIAFVTSNVHGRITRFDHMDFISCKTAFLYTGTVNTFTNVGLLNTYNWSNTPYNTNSYVKKVNVYDSLFTSFSTEFKTVGVYCASPFGSVQANNMIDCSSVNNIVYTPGHPGGFSMFANETTFLRCYSVENKVYASTGSHGGLLVSCTTGDATIDTCFASGQYYGCSSSGGIMGVSGCDLDMKNSFSTGTLEAYYYSGGILGAFRHTYEVDVNKKIENCYSTMLVGLRKDCIGLGGAVGSSVVNITSTPTNAIVKDTYAAGEVGNYDSIEECGGFFGNDASSSVQHKKDVITYSNCYYDKQTTAMREQATGASATKAGITGLLTTTTTKGGIGMASGSDFGLGTTNWTYEPDHYPQLSVFRNATAAEWGSADRANLVKAYSEASVSTVFLDTWETGYDWNSTGVRTKVPVSYDRTLASTGETAHKGYELTYDTVREVVSDFTSTDADVYTGATWSERIPGGTITSANGANTRDTIKILSDGTGEVHNPGMNWFSVATKTSNQIGHRPVRLIAYMDVYAGEDKTVSSGAMYDHRLDVALNMMDTITDNMIVGLDNNKVWSTSKIGRYPTVSDSDSTFTTKYYSAPTDHTNNMLTDFEASQGAWLYTEIWTAEKSGGSYSTDSDGNFVPEFSVYVTGTGTGNNTTEDEKKWNGESPMVVDSTAGKKYIVTYYWMLEDGRYREDTKYIDVTPGKFDLSVSVYNSADNQPNSTSLKLGTSVDRVGSAWDDNTKPNNNTYFVNPSQNSTLLDSPYGTNVSATWDKMLRVTTVDKIKVTMKTTDGVTMGTQTVALDDGVGITDGTEITIPIKYNYLTYVYDPVQDANREITKTETVDVTYKVVEGHLGTYQYDLQFSKIWNPPLTETNVLGDDEGIPNDTLAYINDICYDIFIDLWVSEMDDFKIQKTVSQPAEEDEVFMFKVEFCGDGSTAGAVESTQYVRLDIATDESSAIANCVRMPLGWYKVTELDSNWRFKLTDNLATLNPDADSVSGSTITYFLGKSLEGDEKFTFKFNDERQDTPWAHGKVDVANDMPTVDTGSYPQPDDPMP